MACSALKSNLTACRNHAVKDSVYCHQHRDQNQGVFKQRWLNKHIYCPDGNVVTLYEKARIRSILSDLKSRRVVLTSKDIEAIPSRSLYIDIFMILLINGFAIAASNVKLMIRSYHYYIRMKMHVPPELLYKLDMVPLIRKYLIENSSYHLLVFLWTLPEISKKVEDSNRFLVDEVQGLLDSVAAKELSWYSHERLNKVYVHYKEQLGENHMLTQYMVKRWLLDLKELYVCEKAIQRCKMDHCKEELMMNRWHPSRLEWYLQQGLDMEDM